MSLPNLVLVVTGSRRLADPSIVYANLNDYVAYARIWRLHVGDCPTGVDAYATRWAQLNGIAYSVHRAAWGKHGKGAGIIRNTDMILAAVEDIRGVPESAVAGCAFWNGRRTNSGTLDCLSQMVGHMIPVNVVPLSEDQ